MLKACCVAAGLLAAAGGLRAQVPPDTSLSLETTIRLTLEHNPSIASARQQLVVGEGAVLAAGGAFVMQVATSLGGTWDNQPRLRDDGGIGNQPTVRTESYRLEASRRFRSGLLVQPELTLSRTEVSAAALLPTSTANVSLNFHLPLLKDRWAQISEAPERAAKATRRALTYGARHTMALSVLDVTIAYWDYLAAQQRIAVYAASQARAERLAEETRLLIAADERPAADLNPLLANAATKRIGRITAEQSLLEARERLGLIMGLDAAAILDLPPAGGAFPQVQPFVWDSVIAARTLGDALRQRPDLAAIGEHRAAARTLLQAARNDLEPQLDLAASFGYAGLATGHGIEELVAPLYEHVPGLNSTVQLQYRFPLSRTEVAGRVLQQEARHEQELIAEADLKRRIATVLEIAAAALQRSIVAAQEAETAAELYRTAVANEQKKYRLNVATLFDVILAEDGLTNAMLSRIAARFTYAVAVATLKFETGALVSAHGARNDGGAPR